jgi:hypothetical protein
MNPVNAVKILNRGDAGLPAGRQGRKVGAEDSRKRVHAKCAKVAQRAIR